MEKPFGFDFEWDPAKARENAKKHKITFERAAAVFLDREALSPRPSPGNTNGEPMKPEYDFSKAERGKFYRPGAELRLPIYLDSKLRGRLERIAQKRGKEVAEVVHQILEKDVELLEDLAG